MCFFDMMQGKFLTLRAHVSPSAIWNLDKEDFLSLAPEGLGHWLPQAVILFNLSEKRKVLSKMHLESIQNFVNGVLTAKSQTFTQVTFGSQAFFLLLNSMMGLHQISRSVW